MPLSRREFIQTTASGLALAGAPFAYAKAGKKFRTALIGSGWWGMNILKEAMASGRSKVVALCDVDENAMVAASDQVAEKSGDEPKLFKDYREMLKKAKPEIVVIATPDHWHALSAIESLASGAHVFVEKPTGHTIVESRAMVNAAERADRTVQVGLHRRIGPHHVEAMNFLKSGKVGKVGMVRAFVHGGGGKETPRENSKVPKGMDWDMYCGPAPMRPFNRKIHPGGWRNFLDFANGTLGDWGVHWLDQILWWTDELYPKSVYSTGGRPIKGKPVLNDKEQTTDAPDSQTAVYQFESFTATWEHRRFANNHAEKHRVGCYFYGTKGMLHIGWRDGWTFYPNDGKNVIKKKNQLQEPDGHNLKLLWADFLKCIDDRKKPVAHLEQAHRSSCLSLLGMLSLKLGRSVTWDGKKERIIKDEEANKLLRRKYRAPWKYPEA